MIDEQTPEYDDDYEAAELALGLSEGTAKRAAQDRALRDRDFAQRVAAWQERFVAMAEDIEPVAPKKRLKKAIFAQLFPVTRVPLLQRVWLWQGVALGAVAVAAFLAVPMLAPPTPQAPVYASQLKGETGTLELLAVFDAGRGDIALRRLAGGAPSGRVLELWAILPDQAPISLGVLPEGEINRVILPDDLAPMAATITLAITDEPPGGAPGGAPTGQVMAAGALAEI